MYGSELVRRKMPVDLRYWWVVSSNDISNHPLSNQEQEVPLTGTKTLSSALTMMKALVATMLIPRERPRTAARKQQHLSSRLGSVLSCITSVEPASGAISSAKAWISAARDGKNISLFK